jgi:hypothetical protein
MIWAGAGGLSAVAVPACTQQQGGCLFMWVMELEGVWMQQRRRALGMGIRAGGGWAVPLGLCLCRRAPGKELTMDVGRGLDGMRIQGIQQGGLR